MDSCRISPSNITYMQIHSIVHTISQGSHGSQSDQGLAKETMETKVRPYDDSTPNHSSYPIPPYLFPQSESHQNQRKLKHMKSLIGKSKLQILM